MRSFFRPFQLKKFRFRPKFPAQFSLVKTEHLLQKYRKKVARPHFGEHTQLLLENNTASNNATNSRE